MLFKVIALESKSHFVNLFNFWRPRYAARAFAESLRMLRERSVVIFLV